MHQTRPSLPKHRTTRQLLSQVRPLWAWLRSPAGLRRLPLVSGRCVHCADVRMRTWLCLYTELVVVVRVDQLKHVSATLPQSFRTCASMQGLTAHAGIAVAIVLALVVAALSAMGMAARQVWVRRLHGYERFGADIVRSQLCSQVDVA